MDPDGKYADFHALRHSFLTHVGRTGVPFKTVQELARHSTPTLTMRYMHQFKEDELKAVKLLPNVAPSGLDGNGRHDSESAKRSSKNSASYSASEGAEQCSSVQLGANSASFWFTSHGRLRAVRYYMRWASQRPAGTARQRVRKCRFGHYNIVSACPNLPFERSKNQ